MSRSLSDFFGAVASDRVDLELLRAAEALVPARIAIGGVPFPGHPDEGCSLADLVEDLVGPDLASARRAVDDLVAQIMKAAPDADVPDPSDVAYGVEQVVGDAAFIVGMVVAWTLARGVSGSPPASIRSRVAMSADVR